MIQPTNLRYRVTILQSSPARGTGMGAARTEWSTFATRWADVQTLSSREFLIQGQAKADATHKIRMRYLAGLTSAMRIQWDGRTFEILSVVETQRKTLHELICQERLTANG